MSIDPQEAKPSKDLRQAAMSKPVQMDARAEKVLSLLTGKVEAAEIVLGGYFALQHYAGYRRTHDIAAKHSLTTWPRR